MKRGLLLLSFLIISILGFSQTITYEDNFGTVTLNPASQVNGRNAYVGNDGSFTISVIWSGSRWEIYIFNGVTSTPGTGDLSFSNTFASMPDPPDFNTGTWADEAADGTDLLGFSGSGTQNFLPVELTAFYVLSTKEGIKLVWSTATEIDNMGFEVQRSKDGENWTKLEFVKGHGTTLEMQNYVWLDEQPLSRANYYRLKQTDLDGTTEYSPVKVALWQGAGKGEVVIAPNPAQHFITPVLPEDLLNATNLNLEIYDSSGRLVRAIAKPEAVNGLQIDITDIQTGNYVLRVQNNGVTYHTTFTKIAQ